MCECMKKIFFLLSLGLFTFLTNAQNDLDVLRYSQTTFSGDARFMAMGGSFGALGANIACINYNPAGIAMYRKGELGFSAGFRGAGVDAIHYGTETNDFRPSIFFGNIGLVSAWEEKNPFTTQSARNRNKDWSRRHAVGFSYNKIANYSNFITVEGNVNEKSIAEDFLDKSQGVRPENLNFFYEGLGFNTFFTDTFPGTNGLEYGTYFTLNDSIKQNKSIETRGGVNELSFAYGYAMDNKFYFGASLGIPIVRYDYAATYTEEDYKDSIQYFQSVAITDDLQVSGRGVNLKAGIIYRLTPNFRLGAYVHTPTLISLNDAYQSSIDSKLELNGDYTFSSDEGIFKYSVTTPLRAGGSVAVIVNKFLAINTDVEYINYSAGYLNSRPNVFKEVNQGIRNKYKSTLNVRAGMELNIKPVVFRLGYASYGSPFGNTFSGKFVENSICGGIGFRNNDKWFFDIAFVNSKKTEDYYVYNPQFIDGSKLKYRTNQLVLTYGIKFN